MSERLQEALDAITKLQPVAEGPVWMVGEQLKDMLRDAPALAAIVIEDLQADKDALKHCESKIREHARKHGGCCIPRDAEKIIREHFGLQAKQEAPKAADDTLVSLDSFF